MIGFLLDVYNRGSYKFPDPNVAPEEKREHDYFLSAMQAIYSAYARQRTGITINDQERFKTNRLYGDGRQPSGYYKDLLINQDDNNVVGVDGGKELAEQRRKGWANIDFDNIISYAPKVRDHLHGLFRDMEYDVTAHPIDADSGMMMKNKKYKLLSELIFKDELAKLRKLAGEKPPEYDFFPMDKGELDMYEASGGFKLNFAKAMEKLLKHTFNLSNYKQLKKQWVDDVVNCGYVAASRTEDRDTDEIKVDWVDIENLIIQYSEYPDFRDAEYAGEVKPWTITELGKYIDDLEELKEYAKLYTGVLGNPDNSFWSGQTTISFEDIAHFKIPVLEAYYIDFEDKYEKEYINPYGKKRVIPTEYGRESKNNNDKIRVTRTRYLYKGHWIVGSERVFDYGLAYDQERQKGMDVQLPYKVIKVTDKPITERLKPIYDQQAIGWFKFQNAQAMAANSGFAINTRLLENVNLGGKKADPRELVRMAIETGYWFYSDWDQSLGQGYEGGAVNPVHEIMGGMKNDLQEGIQKFEWAVRMIEHVAGISDVSMGAQPQQGSQVGTTQMSVQGSQNVIRPVIDGVMDLKGEVSKSVMFILQLRLRHNEKARKCYEDVIGKKDVQAIIQATKRGARFGVHFEPRPTKQELQELYTMISQSMGAGKDGQPLLEADEALMLRGELMQGANLKDLRFKLSYKIRKRKEEQRRFQLMSQEQNNKAALQQNKQKFQQEMYKKQADQKFELTKQQKEYDAKLREEKFKANKELKELILRSMGDEQLKEMEINAKLETEG
jgi:hypothetical protein